jgi:dihydropteroate synthase
MSPWRIRNQTFDWSRTYIMGVLNVTPDSFSDGGQFNTLDQAVDQAIGMANHRVDIIDIGGESARPGSEAVSLETEHNRVIPVIQALRQRSVFDNIPISIDTTKAAIARAAVESGADIINDISAGMFDSEMLATIAQLKVPAILMHLRGNPKTMQQQTVYQDLIGEIIEFLQTRIELVVKAGGDRNLIAIDPGIGFAKDMEQNLEIIRRLEEFQVLDCPILMGVSRKSFIGRILDQPNAQARIWGTAAACTASIGHGANILRVHDVVEMADVVRVADAIYRPIR